MKALTLWPEWAFAVHYLGKRIENRTWPIPERQWFALHAGANVGGRPGRVALREGHDAMTQTAWAAGFSSATIRSAAISTAAYRYSQDLWQCFDTSRILGVFRVTEYIAPHSVAAWKVPGQIGSRFEYLPLPLPIACKGAQGLWTVPAEVEAEIRRHLASDLLRAAHGEDLAAALAMGFSS